MMPRRKTTTTTTKPEEVEEILEVDLTDPDENGAAEEADVENVDVPEAQEAVEGSEDSDTSDDKGSEKQGDGQVELSKLISAARTDPWRPRGMSTPGMEGQVKKVEEALKDKGFLPEAHRPAGIYDGSVIIAVSGFQNSLNRWGDNASGIPDDATLGALGLDWK